MADISVNFRKICLKIYLLVPAKYFPAPRLASQVTLKKTEVKLGGICHVIHHYAKASNKYMKDYDRNKESSYLKY